VQTRRLQSLSRVRIAR